MALFDWKNEYSVSVAEIDEQHKKLIALINKLHEAMTSGRGKEVVNAVLKELADYTVFHFSKEENLMRTNDYPGYPEHLEKHQKMTAKVLALQADCKRGKVSVSMDVMDFLKSWLDKHILGTDKQYAPYLKAKGVS
ncbi:MAG: bacteriohemerythrin [Proteobacteria bacterium]|nr:bacteriohemerythrin [Pseudomonadota bacterium]MBU1738627.1 bacteriohemerythrin [Pseudomonadota bacterium]